MTSRHHLSPAEHTKAIAGTPGMALRIVANDGIRWEKLADNHWRVTVDGNDDDQFDITQDGGEFISWAAGRCSHWCFNRALNDGVETVRYHRFLHDEAVAQRSAYEASLRSMTAQQRGARIQALEDQRELLRYGAASHYDVVARSAEISREIADVRGIA